MPEVLATESVMASVTVPGESIPRVELAPVAVDLLRSLWVEHGPLMFHQSGGCCDGSAPMCFMAGEFITSTPMPAASSVSRKAVGT